MTPARLALFALSILALPRLAAAEPITADDFRRDLTGVPLCGTPDTGKMAGKALCTVYLPDGTAILAGGGLLVRGLWEVEAGRICRRNASDAVEQRRCVDYERTAPDRYKNSDGVEFCVGPCPEGKP
jgi:hypothetical protein